MLLIGHLIAFFCGFVLDLLFGDPHEMPHPIRLIGKWIGYLESKLNKGDKKRQRLGGFWLVLLVLVPVIICTSAILAAAYGVHPAAGIVAESIMTYQILACRCLKDESMKVYDELQKQDLAGARKAVSMIVGRDTEVLDETGVAKAAIETVAENTSDGVIAPMLYTALGGPIFGFFYKAVNTMDSMVGYKNDRYKNFGTCAAKTDDIVNYLPARISALLMIVAAAVAGSAFSAKHAWHIHRRDRYKHASPNSAQTESACAGALGLQLAGDAQYFGRIVSKPYIGDALRPVETEDIVRANRLMYVTAFLCEGICLLLMGGIIWWLR